MPTISQQTVLHEVEHILASGNGTLDFAVLGEDNYYTWHGDEDSEWTVEDVDWIENVEEDRLIIYPEEEFFRCEIDSSQSEFNPGPVYCYCE